MLEKLRNFFRSPAGMGVAAVLVIIGCAIAFNTIRGFTTSEASEMAANRMFVDDQTGKPYPIELKVGMPFPAPAPSGGNTGYPAEACYWTKDGHVKKDPTYVLLNIYKGSNEPTFCPDCGRLVVTHNPPAREGAKPPPTKETYKRGPAPAR
jgi:hypothetical protein